MGLLDYYRQFEAIGEEEIYRELRERRRREHAVAIERVPVLDLAGTEWPDLPNAQAVNASIYAARGRVNGYPDRLATRLRHRLATATVSSPNRSPSATEPPSCSRRRRTCCSSPATSASRHGPPIRSIRSWPSVREAGRWPSSCRPEASTPRRSSPQ